MPSYFDRSRNFLNGLQRKYEPDVRNYLIKLYGVLGLTCLSAAIGALCHIYNILSVNLNALIICLGFVFLSTFYKDNGKNYYKRLICLLIFSFCAGNNLGPLLAYAIVLNAKMIMTAIFGTVIVFVSLSMAALLADSGTFLFIYGLFLSVFNTMILSFVISKIYEFHFLQMVQLYGGVFLMIGFVLYDTQRVIIECRAGRRDLVVHALDLFCDALYIFKIVMKILINKEERKTAQKQFKPKN